MPEKVEVWVWILGELDEHTMILEITTMADKDRASYPGALCTCQKKDRRYSHFSRGIKTWKRTQLL